MPIDRIFSNELLKTSLISDLMTLTSPTIVYSESMLRHVANFYKSKSDKSEIKILFSIKSNFSSQVVETYSRVLDGLDCASNAELLIALHSSAKIIGVTGRGFSEIQIRELNTERVQFDCCTYNQVEWFTKYHNSESLGVRVRGDYGIGIPLRQIVENSSIRTRMRRIHFHGDSLDSMKKTLNILRSKLNPEMINTINFGGGTVAKDILIQEELITRQFLRTVKKWFPNASLLVEPGSLLVAPTGFLVTQVIENSGNEAILNSSPFNLSSWYKPILIWPKLPAGEGAIFGNTNLQGDTFKERVDLSSCFVGENLIFGMAGAYYSSTHRELHGYQFPEEQYWPMANLSVTSRAFAKHQRYKG